jgi:hypothetical protein
MNLTGYRIQDTGYRIQDSRKYYDKYSIQLCNCIGYRIPADIKG